MFLKPTPARFSRYISDPSYMFAPSLSAYIDGSEDDMRPASPTCALQKAESEKRVTLTTNREKTTSQSSPFAHESMRGFLIVSPTM
jgi:hypothetical protein